MSTSLAFHDHHVNFNNPDLSRVIDLSSDEHDEVVHQKLNICLKDKSINFQEQNEPVNLHFIAFGLKYYLSTGIEKISIAVRQEALIFNLGSFSHMNMDGLIHSRVHEETIPHALISEIIHGKYDDELCYVAFSVKPNLKLDFVTVGQGKILDPTQVENPIDRPNKYILCILPTCNYDLLFSNMSNLQSLKLRQSDMDRNVTLMYKSRFKINQEIVNQEIKENCLLQLRRLKHLTTSENLWNYEITEKDPTDGEIFLIYPIEVHSQDAITIYKGDLKRLRQGEYLNCNLIDLHIKHNYLEKLGENQKKLMHIFNSMFYRKISETKNEKDSHALVARWTKNSNLFSKDFVFIPINDSYHWSLAVVVRPNVIKSAIVRKLCETLETDKMSISSPENTRKVVFSHLLDVMCRIQGDPPSAEVRQNLEVELKERGLEIKGGSLEDSDFDTPCILHFDSLGMHDSAHIGNKLKSYLKFEWLRMIEKKWLKSAFNEEMPWDECILDETQGFLFSQIDEKVPIIHCEVPQQENGYDCGVYVTKFAEMVFKIWPRTRAFDIEEKLKSQICKNEFTQSDVNQARDEMKNLLLSIREKWIEIRGNSNFENEFCDQPPEIVENLSFYNKNKSHNNDWFGSLTFNSIFDGNLFNAKKRKIDENEKLQKPEKVGFENIEPKKPRALSYMQENHLTSFYESDEETKKVENQTYLISPDFPTMKTSKLSEEKQESPLDEEEKGCCIS